MIAVARIVDERDRALVQRLGRFEPALPALDGRQAAERERELVDGSRRLRRLA
jgi:hypothetical protein